jgi:hypothetical protein
MDARFGQGHAQRYRRAAGRGKLDLADPDAKCRHGREQRRAGNLGGASHHQGNSAIILVGGLAWLGELPPAKE